MAQIPENLWVQILEKALGAVTGSRTGWCDVQSVGWGCRSPLVFLSVGGQWV
jgi:hypothetical protein